MDCNFLIKVSMLMDGELSAQESATVRNHLLNCPKCRELEKDFLFFRDQIRKSSSLKNFESVVMKIPFWKRAISIPVPVAACLLIALIGSGIWFLIPKAKQNELLTTNPPHKKEPNAVSLARFDKGGRAEIYVVKTQQK